MANSSAQSAVLFRRTALWIAGIAVAAYCLAVAFRDVDLLEALRLVDGIGPAVFLVLLPYFVAMSLDTLAWRGIFARLPRRLPFGELLTIRLTAEALLISLPGGAVVSESIKPTLLKRRCGVPVSESVVGIIARRYLLTLTHALYLGVGVVLGFEYLRASSDGVLGGPGLPWLSLGICAFVGMLAFILAAPILRQSAGTRLHQLLIKLMPRVVRTWIASREQGFRDADQHLQQLFGARRSLLGAPFVLFFLSWLLESAETFLILRLLGADIGFAQVISFEALLSLVRVLVFFVPAGLGVQDLGYVTFLSASGIPEGATVAAAFVVLKRAKELVWVVVGYVLLGAGGSVARPRGAAGEAE